MQAYEAFRQSHDASYLQEEQMSICFHLNIKGLSFFFALITKLLKAFVISLGKCNQKAMEVLMQGGRLGVFSSLAHLLEDVQVLRPTVFAAPPTFWNGLFKDFQNEVMRGGNDSNANVRHRGGVTKRLMVGLLF